MSTSKPHRSALQYPLDSVLGSEAQVRLIRVLVGEPDLPLSVADAARLAGLTHAGASRALERLEQAGFILRVGSGRALKYGIKPDAVAISSITQTFAQERQHYDEFILGLKNAVSLPEVTAAWIEPLPPSLSEPVHVTVLVETSAMVWIRDELRSRLIKLEKRFNVIIEVAIYTRADAPEADPQVRFLWGTVPIGGCPLRGAVQTHDEAIERSRRVALVIADLIRRDPTLVQRAAQHVVRLLNEGQGTASGDLLEWRQLLETYSPERLRDLIVSETSRAERLRQSSPFFAVLTESERDWLIAELESKK